MQKRYLYLLLILISWHVRSYGQVPAISYTSPHTYLTNLPITPLSPSNTGGAVPANIYQQVRLFAGSGNIGAVNATGAAASFNGTQGVTTDPAGNVYIADFNNNLIRRITPAGVVSTFAGSGTAGLLDGTGTAAQFRGPYNLATDAAGNIYVADAGNNAIRKITPAGVVTTLAGDGTFGLVDGPAATVSFKYPTGVATDAAGNIYVADFNNNAIRKVATDGTVTTLAGNGLAGNTNATGSAARFKGPLGICTDASGNIYVADQQNNLIRKITPAGAVSTFAGSGSAGFVDGAGTAASFSAPYDVRTDNLGNIYVADAINAAIRSISPAGVVTTVAGGSYGNTDGIGTSASFKYPTGIAPDVFGNMYIADFGAHQIRKLSMTGYTINGILPAGLSFDATTGTISGTPTVAGPATSYQITGYNTFGSSKATVIIQVDAVSSDAFLSNLTTSAGSLTTVFNSSTEKYIINTPNGITGTTITPTASNTGATIKVNANSVNSGTASPLSPLSTGGNVFNITVTAQDQLTTKTYTVYVVRAGTATAAPAISYASPKVYPVGAAIAPLGPANAGGSVPATTYRQVSTLAGNGTVGSSNGLGTLATFKTPQSVATDAQGNVYVADLGNHLIRKITPAGQVSTFAGSGTAGFADGIGTAARFNLPYGIAIDSRGNIYVADAGNNRIRQIDAAGVVTTLAGDGTYDLLNGPAATAAFRYPTGVATDPAGNVYVADNKNYAIRKISLNGVVTTVAGSGSAGSADGAGNAASFNGLVGIVSDNAGNIYVADVTNNKIRKVTSGGVVTTFAGSGAQGSATGTGTAASFFEPGGVALDAIGNLYVADSGGSLIRLITPAAVTSNFAGNGFYSMVNGIGNSATFQYPTGVAADAFGNIYVADEYNHAIRKITATGYTIDKTLPPGLSFDSTTGIISGTPTLATALTTFTITAYNAGGSSTSTVKITIVPALADASLSNLVISTGTLAPNFSGSVTDYTASVANNVSSINLKPIVNNPLATVKVNGVTVTNGTFSGTIPLNVGSNIIVTSVTAQDGVSKQDYTVTVTRAPSPDATLAALSLSNGTLSPVFSSAGLAYAVAVPNGINSIMLTPVTNHPGATVSVNGLPVVSGNASAGIPLSEGVNTIHVLVMAQDGVNTQNYTVTVTRELSADADLSALSLSSGVLNPIFAAGAVNYTVSVANGVSNITVTPTAHQGQASIKVNGAAVISGSPSPSIALNVGSNSIDITVTAADGISIKTYQITVNRALSSNALLANLTVSSGSLNPIFNSNIAAYTVSTANSVSNINITPTVADVNATVAVNGVQVNSGSASANISLFVGANTINVLVTAKDGSTNSYTITITRAPSANANLSNLTINAGAVSPAFSTGILTYNTTVSNSQTAITLVPTAADVNATLTVNGLPVSSGTPSGSIALAVGNNVINTVVTAQDGISIKTYTIRVNRLPSADASLSGFSISAGVFNPAFNPGSFNYTAQVNSSVNNITVTPTSSHGSAVIKVNGVTVASGTASAGIPLTKGLNTILVLVTAEDGVTTKTYTVDVTKLPSVNADLASLTPGGANLVPVFAANVLTYTVNVTNAVNRIVFTPTAADQNATITINSTAVASGAPSAPLVVNVGSNQFTTVVTAEDGVTTKTYTINVIRALSSIADLSSLLSSSGSLYPAFSSANLTYAVNVKSTVSAIILTPTLADLTATVKVNNAAVNSGSASGSIPLAIGSNTAFVRVTAADGTVKVYTLTITRETYLITAPTAFTPNGDGYNDTWKIPGIELYPNCTVKIFERGGKMLFSSTGYTSPWDGRFRGVDLPSGTYYFIIDPKYPNIAVSSGAITVIR